MKRFTIFAAIFRHQSKSNYYTKGVCIIKHKKEQSNLGSCIRLKSEDIIKKILEASVTGRFAFGGEFLFLE